MQLNLKIRLTSSGPGVKKSTRRTFQVFPLPSIYILQVSSCITLLSFPFVIDCILDVHVASFFAVGRPISVTSSIPPMSTATNFSTIFAPSYHPKLAPSDVLYTLSSAVSRLENQHSHEEAHEVPEDVDLHTALTQPSKAVKFSNVTHLNGPPTQSVDINIDNLRQQFRPFNTPPPPAPLETLDDGQGMRSPKPRRRRATHKTYSMTVNILESTDADGQTSYSASASDVYEEPSPVGVTPRIPRQPFLDRMRDRQRRTWQIREQGPRQMVWRLISVKRQRKLKMKKHKYKKLMKKTRTLRRKLERG